MDYIHQTYLDFDKRGLVAIVRVSTDCRGCKWIGGIGISGGAGEQDGQVAKAGTDSLKRKSPGSKSLKARR